jgi:hypothetical protein
MEPHPVPQNIIEVEFKLFGSFTLKQFSKILLGCVAALIIFFLNIPEIIKYPLCFLSVILGVGLAIIPNLGIWINGFLKAIFFAPRYVWVKDVHTPEILKNKAKQATSENLKVSTAMASKKIDITELPLDKLFGTKTTTVIEEDKIENNDPVKDDNFKRVYADVFGDDIFTRDQNSPLNQMKHEKIEEVKSADTPKKAEDYTAEIQKLKFQLSMLEKDASYKAKEEEIISRINDLYRELKLINHEAQSGITSTADLNIKQKITQNLDRKEGKVVIGIVVDKKDIPIADTEITFVNRTDNTVYKIKSTQEGKFSTGEPMEYGIYDITLQNAKHKFHTYSIKIGEENLPAYKFRER